MTGREKDIESLKNRLGELMIAEMVLEKRQKHIREEEEKIVKKLKSLDPQLDIE